MRGVIHDIRTDIAQAERWGYDVGDLETALVEAKQARRDRPPAPWHRVAARNDRHNTAAHYWVMPLKDVGQRVQATINP